MPAHLEIWVADIQDNVCATHDGTDVNGSGAMQRRPILVVLGLLLLAFGLGVGVGWRFGRRSATNSVDPNTPQPVRADLSPVKDPAPPTQRPCVDIRNAGALVGSSGCISGLVLRVYSASTGNTFLDFCQDYHSCPFSSVIFSTDKDKFGNLASLQGKRIEIRGDIVTYQGRAEIVIHDPQQVRSAN
jgi:hypothetical protein